MDVTCTPAALSQRSDYMALTSSGEAIFLSDPPEPERINPEGTFRVIDPGKGMMSAFEMIGGELFALGRGGQVYRRDDCWAAISPTFPIEEHASDHVNFVCGAYGKATAFCFGGYTTAQTPNRKELARLLMDDVEAYKARIKTDVRKNYGTLWLFEKEQWVKIDLPTSGDITNVFQRNNGDLFYSTNKGFVGRIVSPNQVEEVYSHHQAASWLFKTAGVRGSALLYAISWNRARCRF